MKEAMKKKVREKELSDFHQIHFDSIQALRGITALFIILEHIRFLNCGAFGVDIFFCISGFMIMFSTHNNTKYFLRKRLIRILPLYYIMTLGTYLSLMLFPDMFAQSKANPAFLIKSLLFVPFDIGSGAIQPLMRIGWTVNCEIFFYILFLLALHVSHRFRGLICSLFLLAVIGFAQVLPSAPIPLSFYGNPVMAEFIYGIIVYYIAWGLYKLHQRTGLPHICFPLSVLGSAGCFLELLVTKPNIDILGFCRPFVWGLPALVIVLCTILLAFYLPQLPLTLVRLGDISFSLYLLHYYPVMLLDRMVFDFSSCSIYTLFGAATAIAVSVSLALVSWNIVEKWLSSQLRKTFCKNEVDNGKAL